MAYFTDETFYKDLLNVKRATFLKEVIIILSLNATEDYKPRTVK